MNDMSKKRHVMLDIETMSVFNNAAILQIAAVRFDLSTGECGDVFCESVDLQSCIDAGLCMDASTVIWWIGQNDKARELIIKKDSPLLFDVLMKLSVFLCLDDFVWGNSARFDIGILENAYHKCMVDALPWSIWNERDVRTLVHFAPEVKKNMPFVGVKHNALDDCRYQIRYCVEIYGRMVISD